MTWLESSRRATLIARANATGKQLRNGALTPPLARKRRAVSQRMREVLARLQVQRVARANKARAANQRIS